MRKALIATMAVLLGVMLVGGIAYGMGWLGSAAAKSTPPDQSQTSGPLNFHAEPTPGGAWLGIAAVNNNAEVAQHLGTSTTDGVVVLKVIGDQAKQSGLQRGDLITAMDGQPVANLGSLQSYLAQKAPGTVVTLTYLRQGATQTAQVTLGTHPTPADLKPGKLALHLLGNLPLDKLISSTTTLKGDDGQLVTVKAYGGTVTAVQLPSENNLGGLTIQPLDGSPAETIPLGEGVLVLKGKRLADLSTIQVNDRVVVARDIVGGEARHTVVLVGSLTFGPGGNGGERGHMDRPEGPGHRGPQGFRQPPHPSWGRMLSEEALQDMTPPPMWQGMAPQAPLQAPATIGVSF